MHELLSPEERRALQVIAKDGDALLFDLSLPHLSNLRLIEQTATGTFMLTELGRRALAQLTGSECPD